MGEAEDGEEEGEAEVEVATEEGSPVLHLPLNYKHRLHPIDLATSREKLTI